MHVIGRSTVKANSFTRMKLNILGKWKNTFPHNSCRRRGQRNIVVLPLQWCWYISSDIYLCEFPTWKERLLLLIYCIRWYLSQKWIKKNEKEISYYFIVDINLINVFYLWSRKGMGCWRSSINKLQWGFMCFIIFHETLFIILIAVYYGLELGTPVFVAPVNIITALP